MESHGTLNRRTSNINNQDQDRVFRSRGKTYNQKINECKKIHKRRSKGSE